ncbi:MAG TPA: hypothetical protein VGL89_06820 [Candidatus Koribacter sp.]|jgi:hypothetical protein
MRRGWQTWLLIALILAIYWILVAPNVDLDPATPLNVEALFFALVAICIMLDARAILSGVVGSLSPLLLHLPPPYGASHTAQIAPLRC